MSGFVLHERLAADSVVLGDLPLSRVLLAKDGRYPWLILVPRRADIREIHHLGEGAQQQLMRESCALSRLMESTLSPDKLNVAALGNMVPQLHLHHIARFTSDDAWPGPIWGRFDTQPYEDVEAEAARWRERLASLPDFVSAA
ncbi:HIT domain-containing protein [Oceanimonas sp. CHS3-5]|uniref:HIT domain-containing protein n=1 Tax=Oceanimonas sp. CHS3-5 TaxID=3068186 RepID=UPI00273F1654|nr:HIT domain-containing protein [Oceanimonas sp. CHS3-5]MDP5293709.1 HIT domain-containing protein [Oceanimonas sp. CHS3-5]